MWKPRRHYEVVNIHPDMSEEERQALKDEIDRDLILYIDYHYRNGTLFAKKDETSPSPAGT